jgi:hypothetical protein
VKRAFAILFLTLYVYNIAGYLVVFKSMQAQIRREIKMRIKESVPERDLVTIAVRVGDEDTLHWIKENEFRYTGGLFDVVRSHTSNDTTYYSCINDTQEELLFENLDAHIRTQMNADGNPVKAADLFKGIAKDYCAQSLSFPVFTPAGVPIRSTRDILMISFTPDVPTPPPRIS